MDEFQLEKQLISEIQETKELYETAIDEYDILMNFIMHQNLTKLLDSYIYEQLKDCKDEHLMSCYLRLITHNPKENMEEEKSLSLETSDSQPFIFVKGQAVDFSKIVLGNSKL
jgi:hypothetical protein